MIRVLPFSYTPADSENERASNGYLMSLIAAMAGLPLPIVNLVATGIFFLSNRKGTYFVRWHTTQALLSQVSLLAINSPAFWWSIDVWFRDGEVTNAYLSYIFTVILFNLTELIATIYTTIQVRKGHHVHWWFFGDIADLLTKPRYGQAPR